MRNLKKVLSLSLALVMLIGMMVVGAGAADPKFKDVPEGADKREAIEVMAAIGAISGVGNDNFNPTGTLDRTQAAIIIAKTLYTASNVEKMNAATSSFTDMAPYGWAIGAVEACATAGIISGYGDGRFGPTDKVTGTQFAKMLLVALGNDADKYTGATWEFKALQDAIKFELDKGGVSISSEYLKREDAAQMAFNALTYGNDVTTTGTKYVVTSTDATVNDAGAGNTAKTFAQYAGAVNGGTYATYTEALAAGNGVVMNTTASATTPKATYGVHFTIAPMAVTETVKEGSLGQEIYNLKYDTTTDDFGNTSKTWTMGGKSVVSLANNATLEYTQGVTAGKVYTDLGLKKSATATLYVDGVKSSVSLSSGGTASVAGNGALTRVYKKGNDVTITVMNTYVGTINTHNDAVTNLDGQVTTKENITLSTTTANPGTLTGAFETTAFTKDDEGKVVLYTAVKNADAATFDVVSVEFPESITTVATRINANGTVVAGGTTYSYSAKVPSASMIATLDGSEEVLYLDNYGNIIHRGTVAAAAANYAVILGTDNGSATGTLASAGRIQLLLADGTVTIVNYTYIPGTGSGQSGWDGTSDKPAQYDVATYSVGTDGVYRLTLVAEAKMDTNNDPITTNVPAIASGVVANNRTVFLVKTGEAATAYTAYVGINNVPSMTVKTIANSRVVAENGVAKLVFVDDVALKGSSSSSKDLVFIAAGSARTAQWVNGAQQITFTHPAIVNGQITTVVAEKQTSPDSSVVAATGLYNALTYTGDVIVNSGSTLTAMTKEANPANGTGLLNKTHVAAAASNGVIALHKYSSGMGTPAAYSYDSNTAVYKVSAAADGTVDGKIEAKKITDIAVNDQIVAAYVENNILTMVVYKDAAAQTAYSVTLDHDAVNIVRDSTADTDVTASNAVAITNSVAGTYTVTSSDEDVATATESSKNVTIVAKGLGEATLTITFTPTDTVKYASTTKTVAVKVTDTAALNTLTVNGTAATVTNTTAAATIATIAKGEKFTIAGTATNDGSVAIATSAAATVGSLDADKGEFTVKSDSTLANGGTVVFTITVKNSDDSTATTITLTVTLTAVTTG